MTVSFNDTLERFNIKERNLLVRTVLGHSQESPLALSEAFYNELTEALPLPKAKPENVRWWTDYHLNWLVAALKIFEYGEAAVDIRHINADIKSNLEDLDLLVGIEFPECHLIGIEAKTRHLTSKDKEQIKRKLKRLIPLYHSFAKVGIRFHFMIMTPEGCEAPKGLLPDHWIYKSSPVPRLRLVMCDAEQPLLLKCSCFAPDERDGKKDHWRYLRTK
jgi:hypothetical protein